MIVFLIGAESYSTEYVYIAYGITILLVPGLATILHFGRRLGHRLDRNSVLRSFSYLLNRLLVATCLFPILTYAFRNSIIERYITSFGLYEKSFSLHFEYILILAATMTFLLYDLFTHMRKRKEHLWIVFLVWIVLFAIPLILAFGADQVRAQKPDEGAAQAKNIGECVHMKKTENWETCINKTLHTESDYKFCEFHLSRSLTFEAKEANINEMSNYCQVQWAIASDDVNVCNQLSSQSPEACKQKIFSRLSPEATATLCAGNDIVHSFTMYNVDVLQCYQQAKPYFDGHPKVFEAYCDKVKPLITRIAIGTLDKDPYRQVGIACGFFMDSKKRTPIISDVVVRSNLGSTSFLWSTQVNTISEVYYGVSNQYGQRNVDLHDVAGVHQMKISLEPGKTYHYLIQACTPPPEIILCTSTSDATLIAQ